VQLFDLGALMGAAGGIGRPVVFEETYRCYSMAMSDKPALETGDKIILPHSALDALTTMHVQYPMMFRMENPSQKRRTHVGVSEFTAVEGRCYVPHWVSWRGEGKWWAVGTSIERQRASSCNGRANADCTRVGRCSVAFGIAFKNMSPLAGDRRKWPGLCRPLY
jgi:hypothetical protein